MEFTKEQIFELTSKHLEKENGIQDLPEIMLESMMLTEAQNFAPLSTIPNFSFLIPD
ncbi:MAG: hypothetical protein SPL42_10360 [Bacteroidales bacterium]|nr:hypothetical protein [Bacteroidales bacterium]MDY6348810.1 hypothetical protein [Bacteroidales bacterium]